MRGAEDAPCERLPACISTKGSTEVMLDRPRLINASGGLATAAARWRRGNLREELQPPPELCFPRARSCTGWGGGGGDRGVASTAMSLSLRTDVVVPCSAVLSSRGTRLAVRAICRTVLWINTAGSAEDTLPSLIWPTLTRNTVGTPPPALMQRFASPQWSAY